MRPPAAAMPSGRGRTPRRTAERILLALLEEVGQIVAELAADQLDLADVTLPTLARDAKKAPSDRGGDPHLAVFRCGYAGVADRAAESSAGVGFGEDLAEGTVAGDLEQQAGRHFE